MKRVILDTNIYGKMVIDEDLEEIKKLIGEKTLIYGSDIIRKEIRKAPRWTSKYPKNLKIVACATLHNMDIVVSEDMHTMLDKEFKIMLRRLP